MYEMHIGTFTQEGTWQAACRELRQVAETGITVLEIMPVAEFPGRFGWGYDGVDFFAPTRLYGTPDDFRQFVDTAHGLKLGVILDVVYNHQGPDGSYLTRFSRDYFTDRYKTEWGLAFNFDGPAPSGSSFSRTPPAGSTSFTLTAFASTPLRACSIDLRNTSLPRSPDGCGNRPAAAQP
jgi:1,4-alpha-glucan branching enzyme